MPACMGLSINQTINQFLLSVFGTHLGSQQTMTETSDEACQVTMTLSIDMQAEGEMAPDNLYRMTVQLIKVCALSSLQRLSLSLLCTCTYWKRSLLQSIQEYPGDHRELLL